MENSIFKNKIFWIIGGLVIVGLLTLYFSYDPESPRYMFPKCPTQEHLHIYCAGCGSQRAIHDLLHLNIASAISHNALIIPAILLIGEALIRKKESIIYYRYTPIVILVIVVLFMVLRNIDATPFNYLEP